MRSASLVRDITVGCVVSQLEICPELSPRNSNIEETKQIMFKHKKKAIDGRSESRLEVEITRDCPDGGYGWIVCIAAALVQFIILGIHNNFGILYTYLMEDLKANPADTGRPWLCYTSYACLLRLSR